MLTYFDNSHDENRREVAFDKFGESYAEYSRNVSRFVPFLRI